MNAIATADTIRALYAGSLTPGRVAEAMMSSERMFPSRQVERGTQVRALPRGSALPPIRIPCNGRVFDLVDYLAVNRVTGLLIMHRGKVLSEHYELGLTPTTRHASFSLAKSVCSTLVGCAIQDRLVPALEVTLGHYLKPLEHSAYANVTLRMLLGMRTGIAWDETYTNPSSDRRKFLEVQLTGASGGLMDYMAGLPQRAQGDTGFNYSTGETFLVGALLEAATGLPLAHYLSQKLWQPLGMQSDATWWVESPYGAGMGGSGLAATLQDYGRFAQFVLDDGIIDGRRLVAERWFLESAQNTFDDAPYGYQWWLPLQSDPRHHGAFLGMGIFGQRLYLHPRHQLAIVVLAARSKPSDSHVIPDEDLFAAVVEALAE